MAAPVQRDTAREKRCEYFEQANYPLYFSFWLLKQTVHYILLSSSV